MKHRKAVIGGAIILFLLVVEWIAKIKDIIELPQNIEAIVRKASPVVGAFTLLEWFLLAAAVILLAYGFDLPRRGWRALVKRVNPSKPQPEYPVDSATPAASTSAGNPRSFHHHSIYSTDTHPLDT